MSTEAICYRDAYARAVDGLVVRSERSEEGHGLVVLDRTVFYPGGGGQPSDRGNLSAANGIIWEVRGARRDGADILHEVVLGPDTALPVVGSPLTASLDWTRRHLLMRTHTALQEHSYPGMGHSVSLDEIADVAAFLGVVLRAGR